MRGPNGLLNERASEGAPAACRPKGPDRPSWGGSRVRGWLVAGMVGCTLLTAPGCSPRKKLIQWGWDEPDTAVLRESLGTMERTSPFDGCVFVVRYRSAGAEGSFTWQFWGGRSFQRDELAGAWADLRAIRPRRFAHNFLRVNVTPGDLDWYDDFSPLMSNARLAAELARAGRARGILLDVEQYRDQLFDYQRQKLRATRSWVDYSTQARLRGRELMAAFQRGYPGLTLFLTFGYTLPWVLSDHGRQPLSATSYGLLAPFLDGMFEAARGGTRIVDGYELSYGFRSPEQFGGAREGFQQEVLPIVGSRYEYRRRGRLAFGLWLDYDWRRTGWDREDVARNYFTPAIFESTLRAALEASDEYVWLYAETPRWWPTRGSERSVPAAYLGAISRARAR